jgi:rhodanese-related sulfurtransferase/glyoxylase-like metal-dependent hydrolase (beta-lactamase superfamily II)
MIFKQYYLGCLAHASYLIASEDSRVAAVVDPQRDVGQYLEDAQREGLEVRHVFLTHLHADFVAGHLELRDRAGAAIYLGAKAQTEYRFVPMKDGDTLRLGPDVALQVLETPGHTPESISILVFDGKEDSTDRTGSAASPEHQAAEPWAVLTGDTLFVGDVGRPDLRASLGWKADDLGRMLFDSLHQKLLSLPDATRVFPAHGAGSLCGKALGAESSSTIGVQRRLNYALQPMNREQFVSMVLADQPDAPPYFAYDAVLNSKERPTLEKALEASFRPLDLDTALRLQHEGAQLLDVRDSAYFEAGHLKGSLNIGLGGQYATWAGTVLDRERPIVVIAEPGREYEAQVRLGRIGFDCVAGYLDGGMQALAARPELVARTERIGPEALAEELGTSRDPFVLDVRSPREHAQARLEGSVSIPLNHLRERIAEIPKDRRIVVHCASGYRSSIAASLLKQAGLDQVADMAGGMNAWLAMQNAGQAQSREASAARAPQG